jgi:hypothetical protein
MSHGWLSESDGQFQMVVQFPLEQCDSELIQRLVDGREVMVGERTEIDGHIFTVAEARKATCVAAEGELPFAPETGWEVFNVDLRNPQGYAANFENEEEGPGLYLGHYVGLDTLKLRNMRSIHGWAMPDYAA